MRTVTEESNFDFNLSITWQELGNENLKNEIQNLNDKIKLVIKKCIFAQDKPKGHPLHVYDCFHDVSTVRY